MWYFLISTESTGSAADVVYSAVAVAAPPRPTAARLAGLALSVNGSLSYVPAAACADVAAAGACQCSSNTLQTSCSSSDWLAPSVPAGWNYQAECCAAWTAKCGGGLKWLGATSYGPLNLRFSRVML